MSRKTLYFDIECYRNFFYIGILRKEDGKRVGFELSSRMNDFPIDQIRLIFKRNLMIGFNSKTYDLPMVYLALQSASNDELKEASDLIIKGRLKWWEIESALGISIPKINHIDLFEPNPAVRDSLKTLNGRLHGERLQDLPYPEETVLTNLQMEEVGDYCLVSDLDATHNLHNALKEPMELRVALGEKYKRDFRSMSDAQIGESIVKMSAEKALGKSLVKPKVAATTFKYEVPDFIKFETPYLQEVLETIRKTTIHVGSDGKVEFPKAFEKFDIRFDEMRYKLGIGGLHSQESCRKIMSDNQYVLVDADVASQYPAIIMKLGLYPKAVGKIFLTIYKSVMDERLRAKSRAKVIKLQMESETSLMPSGISGLQHELDQCAVIDKGGKIQLNGVYGKLGSRYSVLYAPHLMIAVTLTGQLSLLMLIEKAESCGIHVMSGNTDGVVFRCPREFYEGIDKDRLIGGKLKEITDWWEELTGFKLEFAEYKAIYSRDVNCYMAIKSNGKAKRKGSIANHWSKDSPDYDPAREQMKKNPKMTVCSDAALQFILDGTPIEKFIREYRDIRGFITLINATGGATWKGGYLGKVIRYIWSTNGEPIIKVKPNASGTLPKVPETDGARPMMNLPQTFPVDIDYDRYIETAYETLRRIGYYDAPPMDEVSILERVVTQFANKRVVQ